MNNNILSVDKLSMSYGEGNNENQILSDLSLDVKAGEFV